MLKSTKPIILLIIIFVFLSAGLLGYSIIEEKKYLYKEYKLDHIEFNGTYKIYEEDSEKQLDKSTKFDAMKTSHIILQGKFDQDVEKNEILNLRIVNLKVNIYLNGESIFSYAEEGNYPSFAKSPGNGWVTFVCPGISKDDNIKIELTTLYDNNFSTAYNSFIDSIYKGDGSVLFRYILDEKGFKLFIAFLLMIIGIVLFFTFIILYMLRMFKEYTPIYFSMFMIVSGVWVFMDFDIISFIIPYGIFNSILYRLNLFMIIPFILLYLLNFIEGKTKTIMIITEYILIIFNISYVILQALGFYDGFEVLTVFNILVIVSFVLNYGTIVYEVVKRKNRNRKLLLSSVVVMGIFAFWDCINYFLDILPFNIGFQIGFILFIAMNFYYMLINLKENYLKAMKVREIENQIIQSQISVMMSQIQPHFLYNSLISIQQLCDENPIKAEEAIGNFALFLRGNLDSLSTVNPIDFNKELNHIKTYLSLEKMRFGDRLNIEYDIAVDDFLIPSLTVQPIVENAVRYGVSKREEGGTIKISTNEYKGYIFISIDDDGIGFDINKKLNDHKSHIGLMNVKNRLSVQCEGELNIQSILGKGTKVLIKVPRKE